jgi:tetratricopeptide (TPR) repeat protein
LVNIGLIENSPIRVVSPEYLRDLRRRLFGSTRGPIEDDQVIEVAQRAGATLVLAGRVGRIGDEQFVTWRLVDTRSGESVGARKVEGDKLTDLVDRIVDGVLPVVANACGIEISTTPTSVDNITSESPQAYDHFVAGLLFRERGLGPKARDEWKKAVALDPTFALAHLELGRLYWGALAEFRDVVKSDFHLEKADSLKTRLGSKDRLRLDAARYGGQAQIARSIATHEKILERWPDDRQALTDLMYLLMRFWDIKGAAAIAQKGLELYPDDLHQFGSMYAFMITDLGRPQDALRLSQDYVKRHPQEPSAWEDLGRVWLALGQPDSAEVAYQKVLKLNPSLMDTPLAACAYGAGDLDRAITLTEQYLERNDLAASARRWTMLVTTVNLGLPAYYRESGRYRDMLEIVDEAQQYSHGSPAGWAKGKAEALLYAGRAQEALEIAVGMPDRYDEVRAPWYSLRIRAKATVALGKLEAARTAVEELYGLQEQYGPMARMIALRNEVDIALAESDPTTALEALDKMYEQGVMSGALFDIEYREARARARRMAGRLEEAAAVHTELLRVYGGHALSHYQLGIIYEEMDRPQEARQEFTKFLDMWSEADEGLPQLVDARERLSALTDKTP